MHSLILVIAPQDYGYERQVSCWDESIVIPPTKLVIEGDVLEAAKFYLETTINKLNELERNGITYGPYIPQESFLELFESVIEAVKGTKYDKTIPKEYIDYIIHRANALFNKGVSDISKIENIDWGDELSIGGDSYGNYAFFYSPIDTNLYYDYYRVVNDTNTWGEQDNTPILVNKQGERVCENVPIKELDIDKCNLENISMIVDGDQCVIFDKTKFKDILSNTVEGYEVTLLDIHQ